MNVRIVLLLMLTGFAGCLSDPDPAPEAEPETPVLAPTVCDVPIFEGVRSREVDVAVDPNNRSRVATVAMVTPPTAADAPAGADVSLWTGLARSFDGGLTWTSRILGQWPGDTVDPTGPFVGALGFGDGILGFAPNGDLYLSGIILTGLIQYNMVAMRFEGDSLEPAETTVFSRGAYHPALNDVPGVNPVAYNDKNDHVVDPVSGGWYVSWMWRSNAPDMQTVPVVSYSADGGSTWEGPVMLVDSLLAGVTAQEANLAPAPIIIGDSVVVLWTRGDAIWAASAPRDTLDFGAPYPIADRAPGGGSASNVLTLPMINVATGPGLDGFGEQAWVTAIQGGDGYDVGLWSSADGVTWEGPFQPHLGPGDQMIPTVAIGPNGEVASQFIEFQDGSYHAIASVSRDGGQTWTTTQMSGEPTDASHAGDAIQGHVGDYFGNGWTSAGLLGAWQDGRDGTSDQDFSEIYACVLA